MIRSPDSPAAEAVTAPSWLLRPIYVYLPSPAGFIRNLLAVHRLDFFWFNLAIVYRQMRKTLIFCYSLLVFTHILDLVVERTLDPFGFEATLTNSGILVIDSGVPFYLGMILSKLYLMILLYIAVMLLIKVLQHSREQLLHNTPIMGMIPEITFALTLYQIAPVAVTIAAIEIFSNWVPTMKLMALRSDSVLLHALFIIILLPVLSYAMSRILPYRNKPFAWRVLYLDKPA